MVGHRCTWRRFADHLDAIAAQNLFGARHATLATARTHAHAGDVLQFVHRDELTVANSLEDGLQIHVLAVADVGVLGQHGLVVGFEINRFRVSLFQDKATGGNQLFAVDVGGLHAYHMGLVVLAEHLFNHALANFLAVVVDEEDLLAFFHVIFDGQEEHVLVEVVAEDGQTWAVVDALHAADALAVIHHRHGVGRGLGDGALRAAERAGVAGEAIEAVKLYERLGKHAFLVGQVGVFQYAHRTLLRVDILSRNLEIFVIVVAYAEVLGHFESGLFATQHGAGAFTDADGIAAAVGVKTEDLLALGEDLVVGDEAGADIDDVNVIDDLLGARDGFEVLAFGDNSTHNARVILVRDGLQQHV